MIGIYQNKNITDLTSLKNKHWNRINRIIKDHYGSKATITVSIGIKTYDFKTIVKMDFIELKSIVNRIKKGEKLVCSVLLENGNKASPSFVSWYNKFRRLYGGKFVDDLALSVCPYCNRNFIDTTHNFTTAEFDHFFPKSKFKFLALSFENLVPVCHDCNRIKWKKNFNNAYSPYDKSYSTDQLVKFEYYLSDSKKKTYTISAIPLKTVFKKNISGLKLEKRYNHHDDLINQIKLKVKYYPVEYIRSLNCIANQMNFTPDEIYYGVRLTEDKYYQQPLSKFTKDIIDQIKFENS